MDRVCTVVCVSPVVRDVEIALVLVVLSGGVNESCAVFVSISVNVKGLSVCECDVCGETVSEKLCEGQSGRAIRTVTFQSQEGDIIVVCEEVGLGSGRRSKQLYHNATIAQGNLADKDAFAAQCAEWPKPVQNTVQGDALAINGI